MPAILFLNIFAYYAISICVLYKKIYSDDVFMDEWSKDYFVQLHKKGSSNNPSNYRDITITNILAKIFPKLSETELTNGVSLKMYSVTINVVFVIIVPLTLYSYTLSFRNFVFKLKAFLFIYKLRKKLLTRLIMMHYRPD